MAANVLSKIAVVITANTAQMVGQLGMANKKLGLMNSSLNTLKNTMLGTFGAYAVVHAIQNTVKAIAEFDKQMTAVSVITGSGKLSRGFQMLERDALRIGSSTRFAATEVAGLQLEFGRLGFSTKEILQSTEATVALATATGEDLTRSAEVAGATLRGFNLDASEMYRVTDVMSKALNESALTLDSFADGMKYVAPVAAATNVSLEETAAMLSVLSDAGIKGTMAGTSLRRIFTLLTKEGGTLQERMEDLAKAGISLAQANDEVGLYAQTSLLILTKYYPRLVELSEAMVEAKGETDKMATAMNDNLDTALTKVGTSWGALILSIRNGKGVLKDAANSLSEMFKITAVQGFGETFLAFLSSGGSGVGTIQKLAKASTDASIELAKVAKEDKIIAETIERNAKAWLDAHGDSEESLNKLKQVYKDNKYGLEVYAEALAIAHQRLTDETKAEYESAEAKLAKAKALAGVTEELRKQEEIRSEIERSARMATHERTLGNPFGSGIPNLGIRNNPLESSSASPGLPPPLAGMFDLPSIKKAAEEVATSYEQSFQKMTGAAKAWGDAQDELTVKSKKNSDVWRNAAASIADDLGQAFATLGEETKGAAKALARAAIGIINTLEQITLAQMIADSSKYGLPGIIAAAAGFGVVKGMFARIARESTGGGGGAYNSAGGYDYRQMRIRGEFRLQGSTLVAGFDKANYSKTRI